MRKHMPRTLIMQQFMDEQDEYIITKKGYAKGVNIRSVS